MPLPDILPSVFDSLNNPGTAIYSEADANYAAAQIFADRSLTLSDQRLDNLLSGGLLSGASAGNGGHGLREWGELFANASHQGERDGLLGYDQASAGAALGADTDRWEKAIVGASFSYAHSNEEPRDPLMPHTHADSYQLTLYGNYDIAEHSYLRGMLAYARSQNDADRDSFGSNEHGSYGANEYVALVKAGHTFKHGLAQITPSILARWTHYNPGSYQETGTGESLFVDQHGADTFEAGPGIDSTWLRRNADGSWLVPSVHAGVRYDFLADKISTVFTGPCCGTFTSTGPKPARLLLNAGTSLTWYSTASWDVKGGYDYDYRSAFAAHTGMVRATFRY